MPGAPRNHRTTPPLGSLGLGLGSLLSVALVGALVLFPAVGTVQAATITYSGSLTASTPSFFTPLLIDAPCSPEGTLDVVPSRYHTQNFSVDTAGTYTLTNLSNTFPDLDSILLLYSPSFDPTNALTNLIAINDDGVAGTFRSELICPLAAGTPYVLVTTTVANLGTGDFTNQLSGPGIITLGAVPTPTLTPTVPATLTPTRTTTATAGPTDSPTATPLPTGTLPAVPPPPARTRRWSGARPPLRAWCPPPARPRGP